MILLDKLACSSLLKNKNPYLKLGFTLITLIICILSKSIWIAVITIISVGTLTIFTSKISFRQYIHLAGIPLIFLLLSTITVVVNFSKTSFDLISIPIFNTNAGISRDSLHRGIQLLTTAFAAVTCLYFLAASTKIMDLLSVFRRLHFPWVIIELMLLIYRYIFVILDMADALLTAQKCRLSNITFLTSLKGMGNMLSVLFIRSIKKASLLYDAMESRCYNGRIQILYQINPIEAVDIIKVLVFEVILIIIWAV